MDNLIARLPAIANEALDLDRLNEALANECCLVVNNTHIINKITDIKLSYELGVSIKKVELEVQTIDNVDGETLGFFDGKKDNIKIIAGHTIWFDRNLSCVNVARSIDGWGSGYITELTFRGW